jgi:hypothetical protein
MKGLETRDAADPRPSSWFFTNLTAHFLTNCSIVDPASAYLDRVIAEADMFVAVLDEMVKPPLDKCNPPDLRAAVDALRAAANATLAPVGGVAACGGHGVVGNLFERGATVGLCQEMGIGFVQLWFYQLLAGALLLLLSGLMPGLWHSHHLPPPSMPTSRSLLRVLSSSCAWVSSLIDRLSTLRARVRDAPAPPAATAPLMADGDVRTPMLPPDTAGADGGERAAAPSAEMSASAVAAPTEAALSAASVEPLIACRLERENTTCSSHEAL